MTAASKETQAKHGGFLSLFWCPGRARTTGASFIQTSNNKRHRTVDEETVEEQASSKPAPEEEAAPPAVVVGTGSPAPANNRDQPRSAWIVAEEPVEEQASSKPAPEEEAALPAEVVRTTSPAPTNSRDQPRSTSIVDTSRDVPNGAGQPRQLPKDSKEPKEVIEPSRTRVRLSRKRSATSVAACTSSQAATPVEGERSTGSQTGALKAGHDAMVTNCKRTAAHVGLGQGPTKEDGEKNLD